MYPDNNLVSSIISLNHSCDPFVSHHWSESMLLSINLASVTKKATTMDCRAL